MEREKTKAVSLAPKEHYVILDGLRGVAALMVLVFHVFDACTSNIIPHGYLAVDMFFVLSGFVIGYSYDDRWGPAPDPSREGRGEAGEKQFSEQSQGQESLPSRGDLEGSVEEIPARPGSVDPLTGQFNLFEE